MNKTQVMTIKTINEIVSTFENMSAKKAAPIIESMNEK